MVFHLRRVVLHIVSGLIRETGDAWVRGTETPRRTPVAVLYQREEDEESKRHSETTFGLEVDRGDAPTSPSTDLEEVLVAIANKSNASARSRSRRRNETYGTPRTYDRGVS